MLEWLPQETIFFDETRADVRTMIDLGENGRVIAWEIQCLGRPASGESCRRGRCTQKLEIWRSGTPVMLDTIRISESDRMLDAAWGMHGLCAAGTFVAGPFGDSRAVELCREVIESFPDIKAACTRVHDMLVVRCLAPFAETVKNLFIRVWETIRPELLDHGATCPRIWNT